REMGDQRPPIWLGPEFVGAAGGVNEYSERSRGKLVCRCDRQPEARQADGFVSKSLARELTAAIDQMLAWWDAVLASISQRRGRLADARAIGPMHRTTRERADQRALDLFLQVQHDVVTPCPE